MLNKKCSQLNQLLIRRHTRPFQLAILAHLLLGLPLIGISFNHAEAQQRDDFITVHTRVEAKKDPQKAIGLVLSSTDTLQVPEAVVTKLGDKLYDISFSVPKTAVTEDSVATAIAYGETGDIYFANVTPPVLSSNQALLASIPECAPEDPSRIAVLNQVGPLQQLVDVRSERAKFTRLRIERALNNDLRMRLQKAEKVFGLEGAQELSADVPATELVDRLSRINFALRNYKTFKRQPTAAPTSEASQ